MTQYIGKRVAWQFETQPQTFFGKVIDFDPEYEWWKVLFDDGDEHEFKKDELLRAFALVQKQMVTDKQNAVTQKVNAEAMLSNISSHEFSQGVDRRLNDISCIGMVCWQIN